MKLHWADQVDAAVADLEILIGTETVRARHIQLIRLRDRLLGLRACDPEN
jgi:hypothetical protein